MSLDSLDIKIGQSVHHTDLGDGVIIGIESSSFVRVFFRSHGELMVPYSAIAGYGTWEQRVVASLRPGTLNAVEKLWLALEATELPLMESAVSLTSAKVD